MGGWKVGQGAKQALEAEKSGGSMAVGCTKIRA